MTGIAFLVLGAVAPNNLSTVATTFGDTFDIYVHVDKKVDIDTYKAKASDPRLRYIDNRVEVYWAGFSMVEATLNLVNATKPKKYEYFCLISDDSIPLFGPDELRRRIASANGNWIQTWLVPENHLFQQRYEKYFYLDSKFANPRWFLTEERCFSERDWGALLELQLLRTRGKYPLDELYCGKQWWILTGRAVEDINAFHSAHDHFRLSFKYSAVADETYFQTIFRTLYPSEQTFGNPMYDDFDRFPKPYVFHTSGELSDLVESGRLSNGHLFLRKVEMNSVDDAQQLQQILWRR